MDLVVIILLGHVALGLVLRCMSPSLCAQGVADPPHPTPPAESEGTFGSFGPGGRIFALQELVGACAHCPAAI